MASAADLEACASSRSDMSSVGSDWIGFCRTAGADGVSDDGETAASAGFDVCAFCGGTVDALWARMAAIGNAMARVIAAASRVVFQEFSPRFSLGFRIAITRP